MCPPVLLMRVQHVVESRRHYQNEQGQSCDRLAVILEPLLRLLAHAVPLLQPEIRTHAAAAPQRRPRPSSQQSGSYASQCRLHGPSCLDRSLVVLYFGAPEGTARLLSPGTLAHFIKTTERNRSENPVSEWVLVLMLVPWTWHYEALGAKAGSRRRGRRQRAAHSKQPAHGEVVK
eukprot:scaffold10_cov257-Pinguiococcus_pyrenoidosus.AAC.4